jgi:hypothetical protein
MVDLFVSAGGMTTASAASISPVIPENTPGSFLLALVAFNNESAGISTPAGWELLYDSLLPGIPFQGAVYWKFSTSEDTNPDFAFSFSVTASAQILVWSGIHVVNPITYHGTQNMGIVNPHFSSGFHSAYANSWALAIDFQQSATLQETPDGWTPDCVTSGGGMSFAVWHQQLGAEGSASGDIVVTEQNIPWIQNQMELSSVPISIQYSQGTIHAVATVLGVGSQAGQEAYSSGSATVLGHTRMAAIGTGHISAGATVSGIGASVARATGTIQGTSVADGGWTNPMPYLGSVPNYLPVFIQVQNGIALDLNFNYLNYSTATPIKLDDPNFGTFSVTFWDGVNSQVVFPSEEALVTVSGNVLNLHCSPSALSGFPIGSYFQGDVILTPISEFEPQTFIGAFSIILLRKSTMHPLPTSYNIYCNIGEVVRIENVYNLEYGDPNEDALLDQFGDQVIGPAYVFVDGAWEFLETAVTDGPYPSDFPNYISNPVVEVIGSGQGGWADLSRAQNSFLVGAIL